MKLAHRLAALVACMLVSLSLGAADDPTPAQLADRASQLIDEKKLDEAMYRHEREKSDAEYAEMMRLQPDAFIPGDYARGLMLHFQDFDAGERYARKALAMRDYPHARESLSLALYGKWAVAKRSGRDLTEVRALLDAAEANDPGAAHVPECALTWPPMKFLADSLDALGVKRRRDADTHDC
jgi:hypothetical protein